GFLPGFRTFVSVARAARKPRNPKTGEALSRPAYNAIKFTAATRRSDAMLRKDTAYPATAKES
ncbi:MAG: HU family DNA-binding protein, partial [Bilophila wadsworthia]